jgi:hypothetical protein
MLLFVIAFVILSACITLIAIFGDELVSIAFWTFGFISFFAVLIMIMNLFWKPIDKLKFETKYQQVSAAAKVIQHEDYAFANVLDEIIEVNNEIGKVKIFRDSIFIGKFYNYEIGDYPTLNSND